jgi:saccharopine dehydrogenase-like NADP-dependent oxidoreductase
MKILIIGAGGVGTSGNDHQRAGKEGEWAEKVVISDYNFARAEEVASFAAAAVSLRKRSTQKTEPYEGSHQKA